LTIAPNRRPRTLLTAYGLAWLACCAWAPTAWSQAQGLPRPPRVTASPTPEAAVVQAVEIKGNATLPTATLLYYVSTKPGDRYDAARLRGDFRRLLDTGFLDDVRLDTRQAEHGKIVTFTVRERPRLVSVDYRGSKTLTKATIESRLKSHQAELRLDTFYDPARATKVESILREMLADAGRPSASITRELKPSGTGGTQLTFVIDDGPETQVGQVAFTGNRALSTAELRRHMKALRRGQIYSAEKWSEDQERLDDFYHTRGYVTASVGMPKTSEIQGVCGTFKRRPCRQVRIEIPVSEGERYTVASIKISGLTVFPEERVRALISLKPGDVYDWSRISSAYATLRDWYGAKGYVDWTPRTLTDPHPDARTVDVTLEMQEDKQYFVGRITFLHNDTTRDKVARREIALDEGGVFNTAALKTSIRRLNQLGYFKPITTGPEIAPSTLGDEKLDVTFALEEQNRAQFTAGGGVSGYEGAFVNSTFSTPNLAGTGNTLRLTAQGGKRVREYDLALTNPYFLDHPVTAGIDLYHRRVIPALGTTTTAGYADQRTGFTLTAGHALGRFTQVYGSYTYEAVKVENVDANGDTLAAPASGSGVDQSLRALYGDPGQWHDSRLTATLVHDTVNDRFLPRSGWRASGSLRLSGGPLGGTLNAFRPSAEAALFLPTTRRTGFGLHVDGAWIVPFGSSTTLQPLAPGETVAHDGLPFVDRFAVGGENQVRGYPFFSIYPGTNADGRVVRGDGYAVFNAEHYWDVYGPVRLVAFFDAGSALLKDRPITFKQFRISTGVELRFMMPILNLPLRFIYAFNPNRDATEIAQPWNVKASTFKFAIGTPF